MGIQRPPGQHDQEVREVVFVIPTEITHPYFIRLYGACQKAIFKQFGHTLRPVLRNVEQPFDAGSIRDVIEREFEMSEKIRALVVAPTEEVAVSEATAEIVHRIRETHGVAIPVVALSLPFHHPEKFCDMGLPIPPMVICDSEKSAETMGRLACADFYRKHGTSGKASVLLVNGSKQRKDSQTRVFNFWNGFLGHFQDVIAKLDPNAILPVRVRHKGAECDWSRSRARSFMNSLLRSKEQSYFNVAFTANDDMSLGLVDAIFSSKEAWAHECLVYGFDGIDEMCQLVTGNHPNLKGTVRQDVQGMSQHLIQILTTAVNEGANPPAVASVPAEVVRSPEQSLLDDADKNFNWYREVLPYHPNSTDWIRVDAAVEILKQRTGKKMSANTLQQYRMDSRGGQFGSTRLCGRDKDGRYWQLVEEGDGDREVYYLQVSL